MNMHELVLRRFGGGPWYAGWLVELRCAATESEKTIAWFREENEAEAYIKSKSLQLGIPWK